MVRLFIPVSDQTVFFLLTSSKSFAVEMNHVVVVVAAAAVFVVVVGAAVVVVALFDGERKQLLPYLLSDKNTVIDLEFFVANTTKQSCHKIIFYETIKRWRPLLGH